MEILPIDLIDGLKNFSWKDGCILFSVDHTTPSKTIYQAVCDEIGRFYQAKGFKYAPSSKKLQYQYQDFKIKIHFSSSHYNTMGWVRFEINSGLYPIRLEKQYKAAKEKLLPIILYNNSGLLDELIPDRPAGTVIGVTPFGEEKESVQSDNPYALRKYYHGFNAYNIKLEDFRNTLAYINKLIEYSFRLVLNESEMVKHLKKANDRNFKFYKEKRFVDYLYLYYERDSRLVQFLATLQD